MDRSRLVTATFTTKPVLTVDANPGNGQGTVISTPPGIDCGNDCNEPYDRGTNVTLTADPDPSSTFGGWNGACGGTNPKCFVTMDDSKSVTPTFTLKPQLTVLKLGNGQGIVTSMPPGISCGTACTGDSARFDPDPVVQVTITADPEPDTTIVTWSGDCETVVGDDCKVTMSGDKSVTVTFDDPLSLAPSNPRTVFDILHTTRLN
jgi:hypothetical protein